MCVVCGSWSPSEPGLNLYPLQSWDHRQVFLPPEVEIASGGGVLGLLARRDTASGPLRLTSELRRPSP